MFLDVYFSARLTTVHNTSHPGRTLADSTPRRSPGAIAKGHQRDKWRVSRSDND